MRTEKRLLYKKKLIVRKAPINLSANDTYLFENERTKELGEVFIWSYPKVIVDSSCRRYTWWGLRPLIQCGRSMIKAWVRIVTTRRIYTEIANALILTDENSGNYFHWLLDIMPKLQVLKEKGILEGCTFLLPHFVQQTYVFSLVGFYPEIKIHPIAKGHYIKAKNCLFLGELAQTGNYRPEILAELKKHLLSMVRKDLPTYDSKIWISRKKADKRKINNENDVIKVAQKYGWQIVFMEDFAIAEQIGIISNAKAIGGMSGAGLSNMIFLESGKPVLEIRYPKDSHTNCFYSLADANDNPYFYLEAKSTDLAHDSHKGNVIVDCVEFENVLIQMENYFR